MICCADDYAPRLGLDRLTPPSPPCPGRSSGLPYILPRFNVQTRFVRPARFVGTFCERSLDLSPVFSSTSTLFVLHGDSQAPTLVRRIWRSPGQGYANSSAVR